jgi:conjugative relaxase-like TrwC/TraI family protein
MLGIASLATGGAEYYLDAVAAGREDYYLGSGEAPGYWLGLNAESLGLAGEVDADQLRSLLDGDDPVSGVRFARTRKGRTPGFDLTFSASKSVSLLHALASPDIARKVSAAHDHAVAETLGWLESNACVVRRGAGGTDIQVGDGFVAAAFRHRTSRAGDAHLHTHLLIANLTRGPDGSWSAPDARRFWALGNTASYLYEAVLRHELTVRLGVEFGPVTNGIADLAGISRECIETFSQRRAQILERLDDLGLDSARAAQYATLDTRGPKQAFDLEELRADWVEIAADFDITTETLDALTHQASPATLTESTIERVIGRLVSNTGLTANASTFDRRHILRAWCEQSRQGAPITTMEQLADRTLADPQIVELNAIATTAMRRDDRRPMRAPALGSRYSTESLLDLERQILDLAETQATARVGIVDPRENWGRGPPPVTQHRTGRDGPRPDPSGSRDRGRDRPGRVGQDLRARRRPRRLARSRIPGNRLCAGSTSRPTTPRRHRHPLDHDRGVTQTAPTRLDVPAERRARDRRGWDGRHQDTRAAHQRRRRCTGEGRARRRYPPALRDRRRRTRPRT